MYKNKLITNLAVSLLFGFFEFINIYFAEVILHPYLEKKNLINVDSLQVITGSIASMLSIFITIMLERIFNIVKNPFIDIFGIFVITVVYLNLNKYKKGKDKKDEKDKNKK